LLPKIVPVKSVPQVLSVSGGWIGRATLLGTRSSKRIRARSCAESFEFELFGSGIRRKMGPLTSKVCVANTPERSWLKKISRSDSASPKQWAALRIQRGVMSTPEQLVAFPGELMATMCEY